MSGNDKRRDCRAFPIGPQVSPWSWNGSSAVNTALIVTATGGTTDFAATFCNGNVGIGSASPGATLDLLTTSAAFQYAMITALQPNLPVNGLNYINLGTSASNNNQGALYFRNVGAGSANNTMSIGFYGTGDLLAVTAGGYVGIGTSSPSGLLDVYNGSGHVITALASGNVGIGTTSPIWKFTVAGGGTSSLFTTTDYTPGTAGSAIGITPSAGTGNTYGLIQVYNSGGVATNSLALQPSGGNVGIGTSSPGAPLEVNGMVASKLNGYKFPDGSSDLHRH